ncbi:MAG: hypothetical protein Q9222_002481 [Ikaeria aurantiellina]
MADPFSIAAGTAGLLDICWRAASYLKSVNSSRGKIEQDLALLLREVDTVISVNTSIHALWNAQKTHVAAHYMPDEHQITELWRNAGVVLDGCRLTMGKLEQLAKEIIGKAGPEVTGKRDGIKKVLRKQSKDKEVDEVRQQLVNYKSSLQILLTALSFAYARISQESTDTSLGHLADKVEALGFQLQTEVTAFNSTVQEVKDAYLVDSITAAAGLVSKAPLNKYFHIPRAVSSIFTGREALLKDLRDDLNISLVDKRHEQRRFVIFGLGGSGKTEFCCKFAQENRQSFWGVFYINASSKESAKHTYANIAKSVGKEPNEQAAKGFLADLDRPWLLIIDNADDPKLELGDYFPEGEGGVVLITTRNPNNRWLGTFGQRYYEFEKLEEQAASDLVLRSACEPSPWKSSALVSAAKIAEKLCFLPLALVQAGKAVMKRLCTLETYLDFYDRSWQRIRRARSRSRDGHGKDEMFNMNVYSSYEILFRGLETTDATATRDAIELLKMFSFLSNEDIRLDFMMAAVKHPHLKKDHDKEVARTETKQNPRFTVRLLKDWVIWAVGELQSDRSRPVLPAVLREDERDTLDEDRLADALDQLTQVSLISYHQNHSSYSMHPLIHTWVRERPEMSTGEQALWCQAAITTLSQSILLPPLDTVPSAESLRRHLLPHIRHVQKCRDSAYQRLQENRTSRRKPLPVPPPCFGRQQVWELAKFSWVYFQNGFFDEAEPLQHKVQHYVCDNLGLEHPSGRITTLFLAATYFHQGRTNKAAELQERVLVACQSSLGPNHPQTLRDMDTLGASRCFQGRFRESRQLHETAIKGMNTVLGPMHDDTILAIDNLGRVMWRYFQYDEARVLHAKAVDGFTKSKTIGPTHEKTLIAKECLAIAHLDSVGYLVHPTDERPHPAHELMLEVLEERKRKLGKEQPWTLLARCNLARVKSALGDPTEAERIMRATLPIAKRNLGEVHFGTLMGKTHLAQVLVRQRRYAEAERMLTEITEQSRYASAARDDGEHPDRILALWYLVLCYEAHGKVPEAIAVCLELARAVATIGGEGLGLLHPFAKRLEKKVEELNILLKSDNGISAMPTEVGGSLGKNESQASPSTTHTGKDDSIETALDEQHPDTLSPPPAYED